MRAVVYTCTRIDLPLQMTKLLRDANLMLSDNLQFRIFLLLTRALPPVLPHASLIPSIALPGRCDLHSGSWAPSHAHVVCVIKTPPLHGLITTRATGEHIKRSRDSAISCIENRKGKIPSTQCKHVLK